LGFQARVALDAVKGERPMATAAEYGVHPNMIWHW
jgi:hypothetical protein